MPGILYFFAASEIACRRAGDVACPTGRSRCPAELAASSKMPNTHVDAGRNARRVIWSHRIMSALGSIAEHGAARLRWAKRIVVLRPHHRFNAAIGNKP